MLKIWDKVDSYDENKSSLFTWIARISRNTAIDQVRLKSFTRSQKTQSIDEAVYKEKVTFINQDKIDALRLTEKLEDKYKVIIDKIYLEGYSHSDVAITLGIPLGTVKTRLKKALSILRDELKNEKHLFIGMIIVSIMLLLLL